MENDVVPSLVDTHRFFHLYPTLLSLSHVSGRSFSLRYHHLPSPSSISTTTVCVFKLERRNTNANIDSNLCKTFVVPVRLKVCLFIFSPFINSNLIKTLLLVSYTQTILDSQNPLTYTGNKFILLNSQAPYLKPRKIETKRVKHVDTV